MKRITTILSALVMVMLMGIAAAENEENTSIRCEIENGSYVIRIPTAENESCWQAEAMDKEGVVTVIETAETKDGLYTVRFMPTQDGESTVTVRHFSGIACDQVFTWTLAVKDGAVQESVSGSYTASPAEEDLDPYISGEWKEKDTQFTQMIISKNPNKGWDVEIVSPMTHGSYDFQATVYYDCDRDAFVYENGQLFNLTPEGKPSITSANQGMKGIFRFQGENEDEIAIVWINDEFPDESITFEHVTE